MTDQIETRWLSREPVAGIAFLVNDPVRVISGVAAGQRAWVVGLLSPIPEPLYRIELESGSEVEVSESQLVGADSDPGDAMARLQRWYSSHCDGDWEHAAGVAIRTLDNPGWSLSVDLRGTPLEHRQFEDIRDETDQRSWVVCRVREGKFEAYGGPHMLGKIVHEFLAWAASER